MVTVYVYLTWCHILRHIRSDDALELLLHRSLTCLYDHSTCMYRDVITSASCSLAILLDPVLQWCVDIALGSQRFWHVWVDSTDVQLLLKRSGTHSKNDHMWWVDLS